MRIPIYQIDAFTNRRFAGNPAAVCPLESWPEDALLQHIAAENNLSETAFFVPDGDGYHLRWFTPAAEVPLCGHATLATSYVLFHELGAKGDLLTFQSKSGPLRVRRLDNGLQLDFPTDKLEPVDPGPELRDALGMRPVECIRGEDYLFVVLENEIQVRYTHPDFLALGRFRDYLGIIPTAKGDDVDFVSRFFGPVVGVEEDPVTGSAHCGLTQIWAEKLGKTKFRAHQASARGGDLECELHGDRVHITGQCVPYMRGTIEL